MDEGACGLRGVFRGVMCSIDSGILNQRGEKASKPRVHIDLCCEEEKQFHLVYLLLNECLMTSKNRLVRILNSIISPFRRM